MKTVVALFTFFVLGCLSSLVATDPSQGTGLESSTTDRLRVLVETPGEAAEKLGVTHERIEARVNQVLRKAGITPAEASNLDASDADIYVNINVVGPSFSISIRFDRRIFYQVANRSFTTIGTTWQKGSSGTHGGKRDFILDSVGGHIEVFCNQFLKANGK